MRAHKKLNREWLSSSRGTTLPLLTRSRMDHQIFLFDVGHGDCVLITGDKNRGLLVDCGSQNPHLYLRVPRVIEEFLITKNSCGLLISHYHWDHYSLFRLFEQPDSLFSSIYFPDLPMVGPGREAGQALVGFLKMSIFSNFMFYRILPEVFAKCRNRVFFCNKGDIIQEAGLRLRVLWPDPFDPILGSIGVVRTARVVRKIIEPLLAQYGMHIPEEYALNYTMKRFFEELEEISYQELPEQERKTMHQRLRRIEGHFKKLANMFSLALRTHRMRRSRLLFLGDLTDNILNKIRVPGNKEYDCLKAAHHGTTFGTALRNISSEFVLISRSQKDFPRIGRINDGYVMEIKYRTLLNTEFLGDCYIF